MDKDIVLKWKMPEKPECFFGRQEELEQIQRYFEQGENNVFIQGIGGIGKSLLAAQYAIKKRVQFDVIIYANCISSIKSMIASDCEVPIYNISRNLYDDRDIETEEAYFERKFDVLKQIVSPSMLLVVDNFNNPTDEYIRELLKLNCRKIITSRTECRSFGQAIIPLRALDSAVDAEKLFAHYYRPKSADEIAVIREIIARLGKHTLAMEWIAKHLAEQSVRADELLLQLKEHGYDFSSGNMRLRDVMDVLSCIFKIDELDESQREILVSLCYAPYTGISKEELVRRGRNGSHDAVFKLLRSCWIKQTELEVVSLHPLLVETVTSELKPSWKNSKFFLDTLADDLFDDDLSVAQVDHVLMIAENALRILGYEDTQSVRLLLAIAHAQVKRYRRYDMAAGILQTACDLQFKRIEELKGSTDSQASFGNTQTNALVKDEVDLSYHIMHQIGEVFFLQEKYDKALTAYMKISAIPTVDVHCDIAKVYAKVCEYRKASEYVQAGIKIKERKYGDNKLPLIENYLLLASISTQNGDKRRTVEWIEEAKNIAKGQMNLEQQSDFYYELALLLKEIGNTSEALTYDQKSYSLRRKIYGEEHLSVARSYAAMAVDYYRLGDYVSALECSLREIKIRKNLRRVKTKLYMSVSRLIGYVDVNNLPIDMQEELKTFTSDFNRILRENPTEQKEMMRQ